MKKQNRFVSLTLSILFIFAYVSNIHLITFSAGLAGNGTNEDPYIIASVDDWKAINNLSDTTGLYFEVTNNIDFGSIGTGATSGVVDLSFMINSFKGTLRGAEGLKPTVSYKRVLYASTTYEFALIKELNGGVIENLSFNCDAEYAKGNSSIAVASVTGTSMSYIRNCEAKGKISVSSSATTGVNAGGFVGYVSGPVTIQNCVNYSNITSQTYNTNFGGIIGKIDTNGAGSYLSNCYNYGSITNNAANTASWIDNGQGLVAGGIVGQSHKATIEYCGNYGALTNGSKIGGLVGRNSYIIRKCFNEGNLSGNGTSQRQVVGGIVGIVGESTSNYDTMEISDCYNTGLIASTGASATLGYYSQICYLMLGDASTTNMIYTRNYAAGAMTKVSASPSLYPFAYNVVGTGITKTTTSNYFIDFTGKAISNILPGTAITAEQLSNAKLASLTGFDSSVWAVIMGDTYTYPQLIGNFRRVNGIQIETKTINIEINGNGSVNYSQHCYVKKGYEAEITMTPDLNNFILSYTYNGTLLNIGELDDYTYKTPAILDNATLEIIFEEIKSIPDEIIVYDSEIFVTSGDIILGDAEFEGYKSILFARVYDHIPNYNLKEYGFALSINNDVKNTGIKYPANDSNSIGQYGILFHGEILQPGRTFYAMPYAIYDESGADHVIYGDLITFTIE